MTCCCALNCSNRSEKGFRMFHLPIGKANQARRKSWIKNIGRKDLPSNPFICQVHFTEDQFEQNRADGKILLKWNAVPTLFENDKLSLEHTETISTTSMNTFEETEKDINTCEEAEEDITIFEETEKDITAYEEIEDDMLQQKIKVEQMNEAIITQREPNKPRRKHKGVESVQETGNKTKKRTRVATKKGKPDKRRKIFRDTMHAFENVETVYEHETSDDDDDDVDDEKRKLKRSLKAAENKITVLENNLFVYQSILEHLFNSDQIAYLTSEPMRGFSWSEETINNSLILYESCGRIGYEELRKLNFPFPCAHTLEMVINKFQAQS